MNRDVVSTLHHLIHVNEFNTDLICASLGDVWVVTNQSHTKSCKSLRDQSSDTTKTDDANGLFVKLNAGVLAALPLAIL